MADCPTCGDSFNSTRAMKVHHSRSHNISLNELTKNIDCPKCNKYFETKRGMRMHHSAVHGESISGELVECANCNKEKCVKPYKLEKFDRFFCNEQCRGEWRKENYTGENNPNYKGAENTCQYCGKQYSVKPYKKDKSSFCSRQCQADWQSENWRGGNAPAWKGGYSDYYGHSWKTRRKDIQERDGNVCQRCGYESDTTLPVHHVVPVREFDDPNQAHFDQNMYQVCDDCHVKLEKMEPLDQIEELNTLLDVA